MKNRRHYLLDPGEGLLLNNNADQMAERKGQFVEDSGLSYSELTVSPLPTVPLPLYPPLSVGFPDGKRRWANTNPAFMWHPFMWLPARLSQRELWINDDGNENVEPESSWITRVSLEMVASGLYDSETGTWVDVMQLAGIDLTDPDQIQRIQYWLDGGADEELDQIDLSAFLIDDPERGEEWASEDAYVETPGLEAITYTRLAEHVLSWCKVALDKIEDDKGVALRLSTAVVDLMMISFVGGLSRDAAEEVAAMLDWTRDLAEDEDRVVPEEMRQVIIRCQEICNQVLDTYHDEAQAKQAQITAIQSDEQPGAQQVPA